MTVWTQPIEPPCEASRQHAYARQAQLTKPPGSLGKLEDVAVAFAGFQARLDPRIEDVAIRIYAGDHGVVDEGVSAFPQSVTAQMIQNFSAGGAAIAVLAKEAGASFVVINVGTVVELGPAPSLKNLQLGKGTENFCQAPAMTDSLLDQALAAGAGHVPARSDLFIGGEMGIGNTTSAAALTSALLELEPEKSVGPGTGVDEQGLAIKIEVVARALALHGQHMKTAMDVLRCVGGLEIAALVGAYITAAQRGIPVLVDGYICSAAALVACRINPTIRPWLLFAHTSAEPGHRHVLVALNADPLLDLGMRLGEGSGAAVALPLLRSACALHNGMATFAEAGVSNE